MTFVPKCHTFEALCALWTTVELKKRNKKHEVQERRDTRPKNGRRVGAKREKGDAIIIKTEENGRRVGAKREKGDAIIITKYSEALKAMRRDAKLADLGADVRSVRRTRTGEMILELKRDKERKQGRSLQKLCGRGPWRGSRGEGSNAGSDSKGDEP